MKILIVEDSPDIVTTLQLCFKIRWPEAQLVFTNLGARGIEMVKTEDPDLVILDLGLPDIDGRIVLKEIHQDSNKPIIVLSVRNQESDKASCWAAGATEYITKPFSALNLMDRLKDIYRKWQQEHNSQ